MDKRGNLQNVGYPVFFTPGAIAKLSFLCDGEVTNILLIKDHRLLRIFFVITNTASTGLPVRQSEVYNIRYDIVLAGKIVLFDVIAIFTWFKVGKRAQRADVFR